MLLGEMKELLVGMGACLREEGAMQAPALGARAPRGSGGELSLLFLD